MNSPALTYMLLVIPTIFALAVIGQGVYKATKKEQDAPVAMGFGVVFLVLIGLTYWFFIK